MSNNSEKKAKKKFIEHLDYVFRAPIITAPGYEDAITKDMSEKVNLYRLAFTKDVSDKMATDYEAMVYLHTMSFSNPFPHQWHKIYLYVFSKFYDIKKILDRPMEKMHEEDYETLNHLKRWLFKTQVRQLK